MATMPREGKKKRRKKRGEKETITTSSSPKRILLPQGHQVAISIHTTQSQETTKNSCFALAKVETATPRRSAAAPVLQLRILSAPANHILGSASALCICSAESLLQFSLQLQVCNLLYQTLGRASSMVGHFPPPVISFKISSGLVWVISYIM